jgi:deuterolysin
VHLATKVPFEGIRIHLQTSALSVEDFLVLKAGEKKELKIEAAAIHDLSNGGNFDVFTNGVLPYPNANSTELVGALKYESIRLSISVDGNEAATVRKPLVERAIIGTGCTGTSPLTSECTQKLT